MAKEIKAANLQIENVSSRKKSFANRVTENIMILADEQDITKSDLEKAVGISAGYLSKLSNPDNTTVPSAEVLLAIARKLRVTVDLLLSSELSKMSESEKFLAKFMDKVIKDTEEERLEWKTETREDLSEVSIYPDGSVSHQLFKAEYTGEVDGEGNLEYKAIYRAFFGDKRPAEINGNCYHTTLPFSDAELYVMNILNAIPSPAGRFARTHKEGYEVVLYKDNVIEPLCNYIEGKGAFGDMIITLVKVIENSIEKKTFLKNAMSILESYMSDSKQY